MALGTLVLGYCPMQFDNGTVSSGLSWLSVGMTMMCIAGYAMSAAPVVWILCSEIQLAEMPRFRYYLFDDDKLGVEYDYRRDLPDTA
ncbi:MFS transporter [Escherichia coli]